MGGEKRNRGKGEKPKPLSGTWRKEVRSLGVCGS